jgi:hypothetical protein
MQSQWQSLPEVADIVLWCCNWCSVHVNTRIGRANDKDLSQRTMLGHDNSCDAAADRDLDWLVPGLDSDDDDSHVHWYLTGSSHATGNDADRASGATDDDLEDREYSDWDDPLAIVLAQHNFRAGSKYCHPFSPSLVNESSTSHVNSSSTGAGLPTGITTNRRRVGSTRNGERMQRQAPKPCTTAATAAATATATFSRKPSTSFQQKNATGISYWHDSEDDVTGSVAGFEGSLVAGIQFTSAGALCQ